MKVSPAQIVLVVVTSLASGKTVKFNTTILSHSLISAAAKFFTITVSLVTLGIAICIALHINGTP